MKVMKYKHTWWLAALLACVITACKKPYNPAVVSSPNHYLVVEGVINNGNDITVINLSQTVNLGESVKTSGLAGYTVTIQDEAGNTIAALTSPLGDGKYSSASALNLDQSKKYRLHIVHNGDEYASDYVEVKKTPPIDSVGFAPKGRNLNLYVNTHDAANNTRYYRWDFEETWKFHARYESSYLVDSITKEIRGRNENEKSYYCYANDASSNILIGSSAKLTSDVIFQAPLTTMPATSEKISIRYSVLVKQYALTKQGFEFWENIKKNTEQLGSIFDAQPSQLVGNIHSITNPLEPVIGYISITNVQQKRIYINSNQLPDDWFPIYPYDCEADSAFFSNPLTMQNEVKMFIIEGTGIPIAGITKNGSLIGYLYSTIVCTDCRIRGKTQKPSFWTEQ
jgi:hypothetical protein